MNIKDKILSLKEILKNMEKDHIGASAAQCAYYVVLSFAPFVILLLTLIQYTVVEPQQLFNIISDVIPENMREFVLGTIMEIYSKSIGTISISLIFTLFAADRGLFALMRGLHKVYHYSDNQEKSVIYLRVMSLIKNIIFIILVAVGLVILVFGKSIISTLQENFGLLENFTILSRIITHVMFILIVFVIFLMIYKFVPGHKITFKSQIYGAIFASITLNIVSYIFANYVDWFRGGYSVTYGSLTTFTSIMIWVYTCFYIIFLGAEINKFCSTNQFEIL